MQRWLYQYGIARRGANAIRGPGEACTSTGFLFVRLRLCRAAPLYHHALMRFLARLLQLFRPFCARGTGSMGIGSLARTVFLMLLANSAVALGAVWAAEALPPSVYIEDMTWTELQVRIASGTTTILIPIGGTEQSGPHMVLGKHNARARFLAGEIAKRIGNTVVAPVLAYVPEGAIAPPQAHMRFAGTISIPDATFEAVLEGAARSFKQHGFHHVVFLGDHGGYQLLEARVAKRLNQEWTSDPSCRVHALPEYYQATQSLYVNDLLSKGFTRAEIGTHAGLTDTSLSLAVDPALVRTGQLSHAAQTGKRGGVYGDPRRASAELGRIGVNQIVTSSVAALHTLMQQPAGSKPSPDTPKK